MTFSWISIVPPPISTGGSDRYSLRRVAADGCVRAVPAEHGPARGDIVPGGDDLQHARLRAWLLSRGQVASDLAQQQPLAHGREGQRPRR